MSSSSAAAVVGPGQPGGWLDGLGGAGLLNVAGQVLARLAGDGLLDVVEAALARLRAETLGGAVDDAALTASVGRLQRVETIAHGEKLRRVAEVDARGAYVAHGAASTVELLTQASGLTRGEARSQAATASALARLPKTAAKLAGGDIGPAQAQVAARSLADVDELHTNAALGGDDSDRGADGGGGEAAAARTVAALDTLVAEHAPGQDRRQLQATIDDWAQRNGSDRLAARDRRAWARRRLWYGPDDDGGVIVQGRLDAVGGAHLSAALEPLARRSGPDDPRSLRQRRADALVALAQHSLDSAELPAVAAQRPHVLLITGPDSLHHQPDAPPAHLDGVGAVSPATARQICCDADTTTVTTDRNHAVLDAGRARRDPSPRQRAAVIARDRGCVGCGAPAARCQIHHIAWWARDHGPTNLDNLCLVCFDCHHHLHHHDWTIQRQPDGRYTITRPPALRHSS